jgi:hypothetical protein
MWYRTDKIGKHTIYPYIHSFSNVASREAMLRPVSIPDVLPSALPSGSDFSLVAGLFMSPAIFRLHILRRIQGILKKYMELRKGMKTFRNLSQVGGMQF